MKNGLSIALALLTGALLASFLLEDPGKVTISLHGTLIEMSLPIAVLLLIVMYTLIRLGVRLFSKRSRSANASR